MFLVAAAMVSAWLITVADLPGKVVGMLEPFLGSPILLMIAPLWLVPASTGMHLAMSTLLLVPFVYFAHALDKIWRAHRLRQHGLDAALVDEKERARDERIREEYQRRYGHVTD